MSATPGLTAGTSHVERTAAEPRDNLLHRVILSNVNQVNDSIRVLRLAIPGHRPPIKFLPGQWLDVFVPGIPKPGGFTITSTPSDTHPSASRFATAGDARGYLELAVQESPMNPPAAWLWLPAPEILGQELQVRVGGSFVWPPPNIDITEVKRIVFVAGGVGINPLMSIISYLAQAPDLPYSISFIYSVRDPGQLDLSSILFLERLVEMFAAGKVHGELLLHLTSGGRKLEDIQDGIIETAVGKLRIRKRRVTKDDLPEALGPADERQGTVCYICGVPTMTDELVEAAQHAEGMDQRKVFFERWW